MINGTWDRIFYQFPWPSLDTLNFDSLLNYQVYIQLSSYFASDNLRPRENLGANPSYPSSGEHILSPHTGDPIFSPHQENLSSRHIQGEPILPPLYGRDAHLPGYNYASGTHCSYSIYRTRTAASKNLQECFDVLIVERIPHHGIYRRIALFGETPPRPRVTAPKIIWVHRTSVPLASKR